MPPGSVVVVMLGSGAIVMLKACVPLWELASVTCTVKLLVPEAVGVPEITPVLLFRVKPFGNEPAVTVKVLAPVPPVAAIV